MTKLLIEATHRNVHIQKHWFCQIFWREGEDILRRLRNGNGRSCPVSCWIWEYRSQKIKIIARKNNKTGNVCTTPAESLMNHHACGRLGVVQYPLTEAWDRMARKNQDTDYRACPRVSEQRPQSNQMPWIGHHRLGLGFFASAATYH